MACFDWSDDLVQVGDIVSNFGFPSASRRAYAGGGFNSNGQSLYFSDPAPVKVFDHSCVVAPNQATHLAGKRVTMPAFADYFKEELFQSEIDSVPGNSGGPVFDGPTGYLIGIHSAVIELSSQKANNLECRGGSLVQRVDRFLERMQAMNPHMDSKIADSLHCTNPVRPVVPARAQQKAAVGSQQMGPQLPLQLPSQLHPQTSGRR